VDYTSFMLGIICGLQAACLIIIFVFWYKFHEARTWVKRRLTRMEIKETTEHLAYLEKRLYDEESER
jgi:hypothetical protein